MISGKNYEREFVRLMTKCGLDCHRIAGSGVGSEAVCDCILFYKNKTYLVEVKATKEKKLYVRSRVRKQLEEMFKVCERNKVIPLFAIKFKHRGWNLKVIRDYSHVEFDKEVILNEKNYCRKNLPIN